MKKLVVMFTILLSCIALAQTFKVGIWKVNIEDDAILGKNTDVVTRSNNWEFGFRCQAGDPDVLFLRPALSGSGWNEPYINLVWRFSGSSFIGKGIEWSRSTNRIALFAPPEQVRKLFSEGKKYKKLLIRTMTNGYESNYEFDFTGFSKVTKYLPCFN